MSDSIAGVDFHDEVVRPSAKAPTIQKAVAVAYDKEAAEAPRVVASGKGHIAEQIMQIAFARGIKVREDAELVEILALLDIETPIPVEAFAAVAEILAYVYKANAAYGQRREF